MSIRRTHSQKLIEITEICLKPTLVMNAHRHTKHFIHKIILVWFGVLLYPTFSFASAIASPKTSDPIFFINQGQWPSKVLAKANLNIGDFWLTREGFVFNFIDTSATELLHERSAAGGTINTHSVFLSFKGSNPDLLAQGKGELSETYYNFYQGKAINRVVRAKKYSEVLVKNVWTGIDLHLFSYQGTLKYNWIISPQANAEQIRWSYQGQSGFLLFNNRCQVSSPWFNWTESMPAVYWQNAASNSGRELTGVNYRIDKQKTNSTSNESQEICLQFENIPENRKDILVIDPILVFSTYTGSRADNFGCTGTYDDWGNGYAGGTVFDFGLPVTPGAAQVSFGGGVDEDLGYGGSRDAAILKFNKLGDKLLFCSYLGGSNNDQPHSMVTDSLDNLYVMGSTRSSDFPVSPNAYDATFNGDYDFFVAKFNALGTTLISTYIGGSGLDAVGADRSNTPVDDFPLIYNYADEFRGEIITDQQNVYIAGVTYSFNFPKTGTMVYNGKSEGVVFSLNKQLTVLNWSHTYGGSDYDALYGIALGKASDVFVSGGSSSSDLKARLGSNWMNTYNGGIADAVLLRLDKSNGSMLQGRYHGTNLYEQAHFVQTGQTGKPYIYGQTEANMPNVNARFYRAGGGQFITTYS
ncbi:MAG: hypothetical protein FJX91_04645, partial [Bacteroidetes bacterium]|nr:hypothetical protein [Bacteroidota bacterium]